MTEKIINFTNKKIAKNLGGFLAKIVYLSLMIPAILIIGTLVWFVEGLQERMGQKKMNKAVSISEMISEIKKQMKWSDAILALEIGVEPKNLNAWRKGTTPRLPNYKKLKGIYDSLKDKKEIPDNTTEKLQQLDKEINYLTIEKNKAVRHITNINKLINNLKKEREKLLSSKGA